MEQKYDDQAFVVPLSFEAHSVATECSKQHTNPERSKQIYVTELAIYAVDKMLQCSGINTDWQASDSRDRVILEFTDVGDLIVKGVGRLECCPVFPGDEVLKISYDDWEDRIGYVAVRLDQSLKQAEVLGFVSTPVEVIHLDQLRPLDELLPHLICVKQPKVNIMRWFEGIFDDGWRAIEELLSQRQLEFAFRFRRQAEISHAKLIDLGMHVGGQPIALELTASSNSDPGLDILVRVYPIEESYLPLGVKLIFTDESSNRFEVTSRNADSWIQDEYVVEPGEQFSITVTLGEVSVTTEFTTVV